MEKLFGDQFRVNAREKWPLPAFDFGTNFARTAFDLADAQKRESAVSNQMPFDQH
jgi:hypothetical protein